MYIFHQESFSASPTSGPQRSHLQDHHHLFSSSWSAAERRKKVAMQHHCWARCPRHQLPPHLLRCKHQIRLLFRLARAEQWAEQDILHYYPPHPDTIKFED